MADYTNTPRYKHIKNIREIGIIPKGWDVGYSYSGDPYYTSPDGTLHYRHPLALPDINGLLIEDEVPQHVHPIVGATHPSEYLCYRASDWTMSEAFDEYTKYPAHLPPKWKDVLGHPAVRVLYAAMHYFGCSDVNNDDMFTLFAMQCKEEMTKEKRDGPDRLYHPSDVKTTFPFLWETMISNVARRYGRNLILLTPEIMKDKSNWDAAWLESSDQRPAMRFRYSTGTQEDLPPIIVGAAPSDAEPGTSRAYWFFVKPRSDRANKLIKSWTGE